MSGQTRVLSFRSCLVYLTIGARVDELGDVFVSVLESGPVALFHNNSERTTLLLSWFLGMKQNRPGGGGGTKGRVTFLHRTIVTVQSGVR